MKSETDNVLSDVLGQEHLHTIIEQVEEMLRTTYVKDDMPHDDKSAHEIYAYKPTSWWIYLLTCSKSYTTFQTSFRALLSNMWLWINKMLGVLTFLGHSVKHAQQCCS